MAKRSTLNVSLTPELAAYVGTLVDSGEFGSPSEVVREAVRLLRTRRYPLVRTMAELKRAVAAGEAQARRGDVVDAQEAFDRVERELKRAGRRKAG